METGVSIYKFFTLRGPKDLSKESLGYNIQIETELILSLYEILDSNLSSYKKVSAIKQKIDDKRLIFPNTDLTQVEDESEQFQHVLYDNIVIRTLINHSEGFLPKLTDKLKTICAKKSLVDKSKLEVIVPERLLGIYRQVPTSQGKKKKNPTKKAPKSSDSIFKEIQEISELKDEVKKAIDNNVVRIEKDGRVLIKDYKFSSLFREFDKDELSVKDVEEKINKSIDISEKELELATKVSTKKTKTGDINSGDLIKGRLSYYTDLKKTLNVAKKKNISTIKKYYHKSSPVIVKSDNEIVKESFSTRNYTYSQDLYYLINKKLEQLYKDFFSAVGSDEYAQIGNVWYNTNEINIELDIDEESNEASIDVFTHSGQFSYPVQIADLRVIEHKTVGYLPGEIAHINNTQPGEVNTRETRRLKTVDSYESLLTDDTIFRETDVQSTDRFSLEKAATQVESEESGWHTNASASASGSTGFGSYKASVDGGYASSESETNSNSTAQKFSQELVKKAVDRVSNRVREERSTRTVEEFEERVSHVIDNTTSDRPKSFVYRWLDKLTQATLKNYGKRLIYEINVPHPSHYYLSHSLKEKPTVKIPKDPRLLEIYGQRILSPKHITRENYQLWANLYNVKLDIPKDEKIIISHAFSSEDTAVNSETIAIDDNYECDKAFITNLFKPIDKIITNVAGIKYTYEIVCDLRVLIGRQGYVSLKTGGDYNPPVEIKLNKEQKKLPLSIYHHSDESGIIMNVEIECSLSKRAYKEWQVKCYNEIIDAYENIKAEAETKMSSWDPNLPSIHPMKKASQVKEEIKKESIRNMLRYNSINIYDTYKPGEEYYPDFNRDKLNGEKAKFLENVFDWNNMTFEFHPYYYSNKSNWAKVLNLKDDDPMFEEFLKASYATVRIPVIRDELAERASLNFIMNNSIANYEVLPESLQAWINDLSDEDATKFTYDPITGKEIQEPKNTIDLGIFSLPTDLVILEYGTENGVKPRPYPESGGRPETDVSIPKQYSPAIITDDTGA